VCSPKTSNMLNVAAMVINPVSTFANVGGFGAGKGAYEGGKNGGAKGAIYGALGGATGGFSDPVGTLTGKPTYVPPEPEMPAPAGSDAGPMPTMLPEQERKRRLALIRMGLLSTIKTSAAGVTSAPNLLAPQAFAVGSKTLLGQ
jgi:hypothetical protein